MKYFYGLNERLEIPERVAVVGSAPSLLEMNRGGEIDEFDLVVRFNGAQVEGFHEKVGCKTDMVCIGLDLAYFMNYPFVRPSGDVTQADSPNRMQNALILSALHKNASIITWAIEENRILKNRQHENYKYLVKAFENNRLYTWAVEKNEHEIKDNYQGNRVLKEFGLPELLCAGRGMRTGFRTVLMLVKSGVVPTLYGFDIDPAIKSAKHYYDSFTNDEFDKHVAHDFRGEMASLVELRNSGLISVVA